MHAHRLAYMSTEKGANTHIKTVCQCWSMSRRVQQTTLGVLFMTLVCGINELQRGVCVMVNQLLHPRETLKHKQHTQKMTGT